MDNEQQQNHSTSVCSNQHQTENGITIICSMLSQGDEKQTLTPTPSSKKKKKKSHFYAFLKRQKCIVICQAEQIGP